MKLLLVLLFASCAPARYSPSDCAYMLDRCITRECQRRVLDECNNRGPDVGRALMVGGAAVSQPSSRVTCTTVGQVTTCQ